MPVKLRIGKVATRWLFSRYYLLMVILSVARSIYVGPKAMILHVEQDLTTCTLLEEMVTNQDIAYKTGLQ